MVAEEQKDLEVPVRLVDVLGEAEPIDVKCQIVFREEDAGILVRVNGDQRIAVENYAGRLVCHIWGTPESLGNDPSESILLEAV